MKTIDCRKFTTYSKDYLILTLADELECMEYLNYDLTSGGITINLEVFLDIHPECKTVTLINQDKCQETILGYLKRYLVENGITLVGEDDLIIDEILDKIDKLSEEGFMRLIEKILSKYEGSRL